MILLSVVILCLILILAYMIDFNHMSDCEHAGFYSDRSSPDKVLKESFTVFNRPLPDNKIIHKGYNSEYWDCFELQKSLGARNNEMLQKCSKFID